MKIIMKLILASVFLSCSSYIFAAVKVPLMPMPTKVEPLSGTTELNSTLKVYIANEQVELLQPLLENSLINSLFKTLVLTGSQQAQLHIHITKAVSTLPYLNMDESYSLEIADNKVRLNSANQYGMLRGLATLSQLLFSSQQPLKLDNFKIYDEPTYPWRGLLFDGVRHFLPIADVKRTLRGLASAKFNVFHWHLTDDQGWRVELNSYPKLHKTASDGLYYTQSQIKEVVAYAAKLGIRVVPEFDVPGHASSIVLAYPELGSGTTLTEMERRWGVFKPLLDPSNSDVYTFVDEVVAELAGLFPDPYLHIGGDEVDDSDWQQNTKIQAFMATKKLADSHALHAYFNQRIAKILAKHNKQVIGWDEVLHPSLPNNTLVQSWRGHHSLAAIREAGYDGLLSSGFYIDQPQWTSYHYRNHPNPPIAKQVAAKQVISSVDFSLKRLKGSTVKGDVTLFKTNANELLALVNIVGKGGFISKQVMMNDRNTAVSIDTWMGPTKLLLGSTQGKNAIAMVGNTPYPLTVSPKATPTMQTLELALSSQQDTVKAGNVLGGEATIWAELITTENLDTRLWPRLYAIGERFWSSAQLTNERDMYSRLMLMERFAEQKVGLLHQQQLNKRLQTLSKTSADDIDALRVFSQLIEPAHYYTLHHLAFLRDEYNQHAPLDKLVDVLPVESLQLKQLDFAIADYQQSCDHEDLNLVTNKLNSWQMLLEKNQSLFVSNKEWQASYLEVISALNNKDQLNTQQAIKINNGSIAQVVQSINVLKQARLSCGR